MRRIEGKRVRRSENEMHRGQRLEIRDQKDLGGKGQKAIRSDGEKGR